jgi:3-hydroxybutyryl-CoA dehydrogenase
MGSGITHALLLAGAQVKLIERDGEAAAAAAQRVEHAVSASVARGQITDTTPLLERLTVTTQLFELAGTSLVIEAVPEDLELKLDVLAGITAHVRDDTVIASTTSSIALNTLAEIVPRPERVIGLHFFNPVPASRLVEVVAAERTSPHLCDRAQAWVREWGKTPVVVRSSPGFASSRLGVALGLEAIRMLEEGVASAADIDTVMELGYGFPMGPLRLTDLVGLDVRLGIARYLEAEFGPRFAPPQLLIDMVERGHIGRKAGRGFYDWSKQS